MDVDIVVPWVDGNDDTWLEEKKRYAVEKETENNSDNRFRDWGLLPFWFRMIENYLPWIRNIYFVTWGHIPAFLNINHPKIHIVNHQDYIPEEYLPTFSSHVIELNIHRIPGLADHFIYFNDDTFLLKPHNLEDFFQNELPCTYGAEVPFEFRGKIGTWQHVAVNNLGVINQNFPKRDSVSRFSNKYRANQYRVKDNIRTYLLEKIYPDYFTGFKILHAPAPYLKKTFVELWDKEFEVLDQTCRNRFRTNDDVNQWVFLWWQIASGNFYPSVVDNLVGLITPNTIDYFRKVIERQQHKQICLNDPDGDIPFDNLAEQLKQAFETILPDKSKFEL